MDELSDVFRARNAAISATDVQNIRYDYGPADFDLRHRVVVDRNAPKPAPDMPSAEQGALTLLERTAVVTALRSLPPRQREALVLRYYGDLSEAQIATAMGISRGAVKSHTARAIASLRTVLEMEK